MATRGRGASEFLLPPMAPHSKYAISLPAVISYGADNKEPSHPGGAWIVVMFVSIMPLTGALRAFSRFFVHEAAS